MKKICIFLCITTLLAGSFFSCGCDETDIYAVLDELCLYFSENGERDAKYILVTGKNAPAGYVEWSSDKFGRLYTGLYEEPGCFPLITGYALRLPSDESGFEIHVVRVRNRSDTEEVAALMRKRVQKISSSEIREFAPESFEMYFVGSEVFVYRDTVYLLATPDNVAAKRLIRKCS